MSVTLDELRRLLNNEEYPMVVIYFFLIPLLLYCEGLGWFLAFLMKVKRNYE